MLEVEMERTQGVARRHFGKYPAIVRGNDGPDNGSHRGEILVEVPGILEESPDGQGQRPIRVVARPCFSPGFFFVPEQGAQVWVEFAAGDINQPIWTGVWYPKDKTPKNSDGEAPTKTQKVLRAPSGLVIQLDHSDKKERIVILHGSGSCIEIAPDGKITITDKGNETSLVSEKISLGKKKDSKAHMVLGETLKTKLDELIQIVEQHQHPTGVGPSGPPAAALPSLQKLSLSLSEILSKQNTTE